MKNILDMKIFSRLHKFLFEELNGPNEKRAATSTKKLPPLNQLNKLTWDEISAREDDVNNTSNQKKVKIEKK